MNSNKSTRLGEILVEKGLLSVAQLEIAVNEQIRRRKNTANDARLNANTSIGEILIEQGFITQLELNRGLNWQMLLRKMTLVMSFCAPLMAGFSPAAAANTSSSSSSSSASLYSPKRIEAESFSAMSGVQTEPTTDIGGGQNVGYLHNNDWMTYNNVTINAPVAGHYKITYRVASPGGGGRFALKNATTGLVYDTVDVANTGGWQTWKNIERIISLPAGNHSFTLSIVSRGNGFNLNWFDVESLGSTLPITIQTETYTSMSGIEVEPTADIGGGQNVGYLNDNDWMSYSDQRIYIPKTGTYKITYRVASPGGGGKLAFKEAGSDVTYDTVDIKDTGGWQTWINLERTVTLTKGTHAFLLSVIARGNGFNLNWFKIETIASTTTSSSASSAASTPTTTSSSSSQASSLAVSSASSSASSSPANIGEVTTGKVSTVSGAVGFKWLIPNQRENGDFLDVTELGGYELRYRKDTDAAFTYVTINDAWQDFYNFSWLSGNYIFQISAFDKNGMYSGFVDLIPR